MLKQIAALAATVIIVVVYLVMPSFYSEEAVQFDPYSQGWENLAKVRDTVSAKYDTTTVLTSPALLHGIENPKNYLLLVISIEQQYRPSEMTIIKDFVNNGGNVIFADDQGYGNEVAREFGLQFYGQRVWDANFKDNESLPKIGASLNISGSEEKYLLLFNRPTGLQIPETLEGVTVIAQGSSESFVDLNGNGMVDPNDKKGNIPIIASVQHGKGKAVFIADSGIFINDMIDEGGFEDLINSTVLGNNTKFLMDLISTLLPKDGKVVFDESRHLHDKYSENIYTSIQASILVTTEYRVISLGDQDGEWLEFGLFIFGVTIIIVFLFISASDADRWSHKFDLGAVTRRRNLPENKSEQINRLKKAVFQKARVLNSMSEEEFAELTPAQLGKLITDSFLVDFLSSSRSYSDQELKEIAEKIRKWSS